jgi:hypothetical protein
MPWRRYREITVAMQFTDAPPPTIKTEGFVDRFHEVRNMIDCFNQYYSESNHPSWLNCLDESMSSWLNKFCPGFMCVPRKPHPFSNEYHSIADGDDGKPIMWRVKIVEGTGRPKKADGRWAFPSEFNARLGKTTTTMLELTKLIHGKGKVVVGGSGFCVREGVVECLKVGVWFQAYVKKCAGTGLAEGRETTSTATSKTCHSATARPTSQNTTISSFVSTVVVIPNMCRR